MSGWGWVSSLRSQISPERFRVTSIEWETDVPLQKTQGQLASKFEGEEPTDHDVRWRGSTTKFGFPQRLVLTSDGRVRVSTEWSHRVRVAAIAMLLLSPAIIAMSPILAAVLYASLAFVLDGPTYSEQPVTACTVTVREHSHSILGFYWVVVIASAATPIFKVLDSWVSYIPFVTLGLLTLPILYLNNALPVISPSPAMRVLKIPITMLSNCLEMLVLLYPFLMASGIVFGAPDTITGWVAPSYDPGKGSVLSDYTGGAVRANPSQAPDPTVVQEFFYGLLGDLMLILLVVMAIQFYGWLRVSKQLRNELVRRRLSSFDSNFERYGALVAIAVLNVVILGIAVVALSVLAYGATGEIYAPARALAPTIQVLQMELRVPLDQFLEGIYRVLDYNLRGIPLVVPRTASLVVLGIFLWPFLFIIAGTVCEILARPYRTVAALRGSTPLTESEGQSLLSSDIQIRSMPLDGEPDARPLVVLFGLRNYVVVSEVVVEELTDRQLEAVLRHEEYHIRERDPGLVTEGLSFLFGGKNATLAFYDYRQSERKADRYAKRKTSATAIRRALDEMYRLKSEARRQADRVPSRHPGIVSFESLTADGVTEHGTEFRARVMTTISTYLRAPYDLYFGSVLVETAHADSERRLEYLSEE